MEAVTIQDELVHVLGPSCQPSYRKLVEAIHQLLRALTFRVIAWADGVIAFSRNDNLPLRLCVCGVRIDSL
jgi:hypothetical protein